MPRVEAAARSHTGKVRENNEDNFFLNGVFMREQDRGAGGLFKGSYEDKRQLYAVCDGMGGMDSGEAASLLTVSRLHTLLPAGLRGLPQNLRAFIDETSAALQPTTEGARLAGCTLAMVYLDGARVSVAHLGDSRVYFKRDALALTQVTEDHSQAMWYARQGILSPEEAEFHKSRNKLRRFIGAPVPEGRAPDITAPMRFKRGDVFLICSDGLSNMMSEYEMDAEIASGKSCSDACRSLVTLALARGGTDNVTALMVKIC